MQFDLTIDGDTVRLRSVRALDQEVRLPMHTTKQGDTAIRGHNSIGARGTFVLGEVRLLGTDHIYTRYLDSLFAEAGSFSEVRRQAPSL